MNIAFVVLIIALNGIRNIGSNMMIPMMADCTDYEVYRSGHYVPGLIATVYSFIDKLISSFATTAVGAFVAVIGYKNSVPQVEMQAHLNSDDHNFIILWHADFGMDCFYYCNEVLSIDW